MDYTGINLPEYVTIVENKYGQGYVVPEGSSLDNARTWAESKDWKPKEYKYKNGTFTLRATNAAGYSSQGGKLSFWNCQIRTEDEKEFLIGIASDCLAELIINNTLINGKCQNKIYFAKYKGNSTYAVTENMPSYKVALEDKKIKETKTTVKYEPGDLVGSLTYTELYLGEIYEYISVYQLNFHDRYFKHLDVNGREYDKLIVINDKPTKYHWLVGHSDYEEECFDNNPQFFHSYSLYKNKLKRRIIKKSYASKDYVKTALEESIKYTADKSSEIFTDPIPKMEVYLRQATDVYSRKGDLPQPNKESIQELCDKYYSMLSGKRELRYEYSYVIYEHDLTPELLEAIKSGQLVRA